MALVGESVRTVTRDEVARSITGRKRHVGGMIFVLGTVVALLGTLVVLFTLIAQLIAQAWPVITDRGVNFLTDGLSSRPSTIGVWPGLYGSFAIGIIVLIVAIPLGVAAAVYLEEYAPSTRLTRFIVVNIRNLAGVPAVIYGVLGLTIFVGWLDPITSGRTILAAGLAVAVLVLPIVIITSTEAIRAVPGGLREAGYGVGATKWEVVRDHVLPYAAPGILTGIVLSLARALGEAAPLILVGAITGLLPETSLNGPFTALPMLVYSWSGRPSAGTDVDWANVAAAAGLTLVVLVLLFNAAAIVMRNHFERKRNGL